MRRIHELDGLRAVAIFLVLGCHYEGFSRLFWHIPQLGWIGVDLFFCLSGYLITTILLGLRGRTSPYKTFYSRRLIRILPPYVAVIVFVGLYTAYASHLTLQWLATQLFFLQAFHVDSLRAIWDILTHARWHLHHLPSLLTNAGRLYHEQAGAQLSILIVQYILWSLSIEEYFYLLWAPVVLRFPIRFIVLIGILISVLEMLLRWAIGTPAVYFDVAFRFDALLYGAFLAILLNRWRTLAQPRWAQGLFSLLFAVAVAGIAGILFVIHPILGRDPRSSPLFLVLGLPLLSVAVAALMGLLILRSNSAWWLSRLLRNRAFQFVGTISYTMYLVHLIAAAIIRALFHVSDVFHQTLLQAILSTLLTIAIAQISWILLEKRILHWKDKRFPNSPHPPEPDVPGLGPAL